MFTGLESPTHLIIVLVIVLLLFGAKRVPELAKAWGRGYASSGRGRGEKARRNWTRLQTTVRSANPASSFLRRTHLPNLVEGKFCELRLQGVLGSRNGKPFLSWKGRFPSSTANA